MASEAARLDLYNGLTEILGTERDETLMAALPTYDISELATKSDIDLLATRLASVETIVIGLGARMDRMFLAMLAGLFVIVATMAGVLLTV
ncbi:MAG: hypothetical protein ACRDX9_00350 [Acidimicrobiia bacterium]